MKSMEINDYFAGDGIKYYYYSPKPHQIIQSEKYETLCGSNYCLIVRVVSVGQLSCDCRSYCGHSRLMQGLFCIYFFRVSFPFVWGVTLWKQGCKLLWWWFCQISRDGVTILPSLLQRGFFCFRHWHYALVEIS